MTLALMMTLTFNYDLDIAEEWASYFLVERTRQACLPVHTFNKEIIDTLFDM